VDPRPPALLLAHGAGGNAESMRPWVRALARHDVHAIAIDLPRGRAERAVPAYREALARYPGAAIGGHSFGGRVASLLAAEQPVPALVLLSYPLHPPGRPDDLRTSHWPNISCPVLLLSGEADEFATIELLREWVPELPDATLVTYPNVTHGLGPVVLDAAERVAAFLESLP